MGKGYSSCRFSSAFFLWAYVYICACSTSSKQYCDIELFFLSIAICFFFFHIYFLGFHFLVCFLCFLSLSSFFFFKANHSFELLYELSFRRFSLFTVHIVAAHLQLIIVSLSEHFSNSSIGICARFFFCVCCVFYFLFFPLWAIVLSLFAFRCTPPSLVFSPSAHSRFHYWALQKNDSISFDEKKAVQVFSSGLLFFVFVFFFFLRSYRFLTLFFFFF